MRATIIKHVPFEGIGAFGKPLEDAEIGCEVIHAATQPLDAAKDADLTIVMGGPISANDQLRFPFLAEELALLEYRIQAGKLTIGVCLGAQLIAKAMGADVYPMPQKEIIWSAVELTEAGMNSPLAKLTTPVLHWHGEMFDVPDGADHLACTPLCAHQAFAIARHTLALQFHAEVERHNVEQWLLGHINELDQAGVDLSQLRRDTTRWATQNEINGQRMLRQWLEINGVEFRRTLRSK